MRESHYMEQLNKRRQQAATLSGISLPDEKAQISLYQPQPAGDAEALLLPTVVRFRPYGLSILLTGVWLLGFWGILFLVMCLPYWISILAFPTLSPSLGIENFTRLIIILFAALFLLYFLSSMRRVISIASMEIEVVDEGMRIHEGTGKLRKTHYLPWSDVRLFACLGLPTRPSKPDHLPISYEIAGEQDLVRWPSGLKCFSWLMVYTKVDGLTDEEYQQLVQKILSLIVAKTGRPFYDLR
jgi:hypothetical protein